MKIARSRSIKLISLIVSIMILICCMNCHKGTYQNLAVFHYGKNGCIPKGGFLLDQQGRFYDVYHPQTGFYFIQFDHGFFHPQGQPEDPINNLHLKCLPSLADIWNEKIDSLVMHTPNYEPNLLQVGICSDTILRTSGTNRKRYFLEGALLYNGRQFYPRGTYCERDH